MRVTTTFGSLILGAGLCAARACVPHPRPTTTSSFSSEIGTTTAEASATTTTSQETLSVTASESSIESSVTPGTSTAESATTELETVTSSTEASTTTNEATSTTVEATSTTTGLPVVTNLVVNGGFEDSTIEPWVVDGTSPEVTTAQGYCPEGSKCLQLPGNLDNTARICQSVAVEYGFQYTVEAQVSQNCIKSFGSNILSCDDNINTVELSVEGVYDSGGHGIAWSNTFNDFTYTFGYVGPSIDSTDLCITITQNQGIYPTFYLDNVSFTRGKAIPVPPPPTV